MKTLPLLLILTILQFFLSAESGAEVKNPRNPDSAKECAICHFRWIDTFYLDRKGSDLVEYQSEIVVAKEEICFTCHDGSVVDSRGQVYNDHRHKVNEVPPVDMKFPKEFPLDKNGKMQCSTCHSAHGVSSEMGIEKTIFLRASNENSGMCIMCHDDKGGGIDEGNHPMGKLKDFTIPDELIYQGSKEGGDRSHVICETCHTAHGSPNESFLIESARNSQLCLECHRDKNIFSDEGIRRPFHVINSKFEKVKIPAELIDRGAKLGSNDEIICQTCHKVHNNKIEKQLLLIKKDKGSTLCLTCHTDKQYLENTKHNLNHSAPDEKNLEGKTVSEAGICSSCHLPHKAARELKEGDDFTTSICLSCHSKSNIAEETILDDYRHPVDVNPFEKKDSDSKIILTTISAEKESLELPLFNVFGAQDRDGAITCATCHDPHRWNADSTEGEIRKEVKGDMNTSFLRSPSPELCSKCHDAKFNIRNSEHDMSIVAPDEKNILGQKPSESGLCGICHIVHGGQKDYLWGRTIETDTGNVVQDLCVSCHNEKGIANKKVVKNYSHPVNVKPSEDSITTILPLFNEQGRVSGDGFMTCQTCHDPHRWNPNKVMKGDHSDVEGDATNSFLRLEASRDSALCVTCHARQAVVRGTDHDLNVTAPEAKNVLGKTVNESGSCGACHIVHNGPNRMRLWGRSYDTYLPRKELINSYCTGCHSIEELAKDTMPLAKDKVPSVDTHPENMLIDNVLRNDKDAIDFAPLFDINTGEYITVGNISCPTCHNAHKWSPVLNKEGSYENVEGDVTNSFLRNVSYNNICIDCHGFDALFRFKYYHNPFKRVENFKR